MSALEIPGSKKIVSTLNQLKFQQESSNFKPKVKLQSMNTGSKMEQRSSLVVSKQNSYGT